MYAEYFGLAEPPFSIAPDPRYLYPSAQHLEALAHLAYGASEGDGFIQLTGEVGTGKTTLIRRLLADLPEGIEIAFVFNPEVSPRGLLTALIAELGLPRAPAGAEHGELVARLYRHLLAAHTRGQRVVLVIDEAQRLGPEVLEEVRLLTNFETDRRKLLNVILVGQPELRETLARPDLRQLAQRITGRYHLGPFALADTDAYIRHRLRLAGAPGRIFRSRAVAAIQRHSRGIPRLINLICDRALMAAYTRGLREVDAAVVRDAVRDIAGVSQPRRSLRPLWLAAGLAVAVFAGGALAWWLAGGGGVHPAPAATVVLAGPSAQTAPQPVVARAKQTASAVAAGAASAGTAAKIAGEVTAMNPEQSIRQWLAALPTDSPHGATNGLLALWGVSNGGADDPCLAASRAGLSCLREQGNLNLLRVFNRPAVVTLHAAGGPVRVVVEALSTDRITLALAQGQKRSFPVAAFERLWYGRMWLLWRPPHDVNVMRRGMSGPAVAWLRHALGLAASASNPGYDSALATAVRTFQRRHNLEPDGIAGPETLIVVRQSLGNETGPHLDGS
ncbi:MAG: AAA family ATPase [Gammaproteobacteria bacterium]